MPKEKEQKLEDILWNCRTTLRGVASIDKQRNAVITLTFLKFASDKFEKQREKIRSEHEDDANLDYYLGQESFYACDNVFYLEEEARWEYINAHSSDNDIELKLDKALKEIENDNVQLAGALQQNLFVDLHADQSSLKELIDEVNKINEDRFPGEDLIGRVYEYFISLYAAAGEKGKGEFYTPSSIVQLMTELIEPYRGIVYDPCCGSGGMFVQSMKFVEKHQGNKKEISIYGQESNDETWRLCKMNLAIRGIQHNLGPKQGDTFKEDLHLDQNHKVNYIMANPPFNLKKWWKGKHEDYVNDKRWIYGLPRLANGNYAWIEHMIYKLDPKDGVAAFLLSNGALGDSGDSEVRENLIKDDKVEAIITLPRDMFYTTDISVTLWVVRMNKNAGEINGRKVRDRRNEILFIDLRTWNKNESKVENNSTKTKVYFSSEQINKVKDVYNAWQSPDMNGYKDVPEFCRSTKIYDKDITEEDRKNGLLSVESQDYVLMPSRYIEFVDHDLDIDYEEEMTKIQSKMKANIDEEKETQKLLEDAFKEIGYGID